ncbi:MAG: sulfite exporter TauE/SafE family protein [bacterium]
MSLSWLLVCLFMNVYLFFQMRQHIPWEKLLVLLISSMPGLFIGVYFLKNVPSPTLLLFLGIIIVLFACYEIFWKPVKKETHPRWEYLVGFLGGFCAASLGNGSPLIIYTALQPWPKNLIKSVLVAFFLLNNIVTVIAYFYAGLVTPAVTPYVLAGIPAAVVGTVLGHRCYQKTSEELYRKIISYFLLLMGALTLYKAFR